MNDALINRNAPGTGIRTTGFSDTQFNFHFPLPPVPVTSAGSLKDAVDTVLATFFVPRYFGAVEILKMGFHLSAAGGAVTTSGTMKLTIAAVDVEDAEGNVIDTTALAASADAYSVVEQDLNRTLKATNLQAVPDYPYALANELVQLKVAIQGVGAGAQTIWPYLIVRVHPRNRDLWGSIDDGGT